MFKSLRRRQSIPVCRRFKHRYGGFAGVAPAKVIMAYPEKSYSACDTGPNAATLVVSSDCEVASPADGVMRSGAPARLSAGRRRRCRGAEAPRLRRRETRGQFLAPLAPIA